MPMRSAGVVPCKQALCINLVDVLPVVAKHSIVNKSWDKSLMVGYNLEPFANSAANLEHVSIYFYNLVDKNGTLSNIFHEICLLHCEYARPSGRVMVSLKVETCASREKIKGL